jgi:hypothetical protein
MWKRIVGWAKLAKEWWDWLGLAWQLAGLLGIGGFVVAAISGIWAWMQGLPGPFVLTGVFCVLVISAQLVLSWLIYQAVTKPKPVAATPERAVEEAIDYKPVRLQHEYSLLEASRLWVGLWPSAPVSPKSDAWQNALKSAIQQGQLNIQPRNPSNPYAQEDERRSPNLATVVTRKELKRYAVSIGEAPEFLRDE